MKYLNKFSKFFKRKNEKKVPFEQVLINLQKFIDSVCPDEVSVRYHPKMVINDIKIQNFIPPADQIPKSLGLGRIKITLLQDNENYILITLPYNDQMKFDMLYWGDHICQDGVMQRLPTNTPPGYWIPQISHGEEGSLFDKVREYLIDNNLVGPVD